MSQVLVESLRGSLVEDLHRGDIAVVDAVGRLLFWCGEPARKVTFWRSSAKPFQAMPLVESGAADRWGFDAADLAICCASHAAEPAHQQQVLSVLGKAGLSTEVLRCGPHAPGDRAEAETLVRRGEKPGVLHSNCSGKHAGMCALAKHLALSPEGYLAAEHGVQKLILANVAVMADLPADQVVIGIDGCGVPVFGLPVYSMAVAFARLADPRDLPAGKQAAVDRIRSAMTTHPHLVAGRDRFDTVLMVEAPGLVAKGGAAGICCIGVSPERAAAAGLGDRGLGIALKIEDGNGGEPRVSAGVETLAQLGLLSAAELQALQRFHRPVVRNFAGQEVGSIRPAFKLQSD